MDSVIAPMKRVFSLPLARKARPKPNRPPVRILFVDVGNACRSQVAQAYGLLEGFHAESAGTFPSLDLDPMAVRVLREQGLDISGFRPKVLDVTRLGAYDRVILLGASLPQAYRGLPQVQAWNVLDPHDLPYEAYIRMRDECEAKVRALAREYHVRPPEALLLEA
jgi:arsenate reductase